MPTRTLMFDENGNETDDRSRAVRGEVVELDDDGNIVRRYPDLTWQIDERALEGDAGRRAGRRGAMSEHRFPEDDRLDEPDDPLQDEDGEEPDEEDEPDED